MSLDYANERWVRLYTRDTATWLLLSWQARTVLLMAVRKADRSGLIDLGCHARSRAVTACAALLGLPEEIVGVALPELQEVESLVATDSGFLLPNFVQAQETPVSDVQRKRESREKRRGHEMSRAVTPSHKRSQTVTLRQDKKRDIPLTPATGEFASAFVAELNQQTGKRYQVTPVVLEAAVKLVRLGHTADEARLVVRAKATQWRSDPKMAAHLTPKTLLRMSNFPSYLDEAKAGANGGGGYAELVPEFR